MVQGHSECPEKYVERAGEKGQVELCWSHVEMVGTLLGIVCNLSFLLLGIYVLVPLRANLEKQYKGGRWTAGRMEETV